MATWVAVQSAALCTVLTSFYLYDSPGKHSLTQHLPISAPIVCILCGCFCFAASLLSDCLSDCLLRDDTRPSFAKRRDSHDGAILGVHPEGALLQGSFPHLPSRPGRLTIPVLIVCMVARIEVFDQVYRLQQCAVPGTESFLCLLLIGLEIFSTRRNWGLPPNEYDGDPWRTIWEDLYDWFSGPRVTLVFTVLSALSLSLGTQLTVSHITRSTYVCFAGTDGWLNTQLLQCLGLALDAVALGLLWRTLAWTKSTGLRLRTLASVSLMSGVCLACVSVGKSLWAGQRPATGFVGSQLFGEVVVDSFWIAALLVSATFWMCKTSPIAPVAVVTIASGLWTVGDEVLHAASWQYASRASILAALWLLVPGAVMFVYSHDIRTILFIKRFFFAIVLAVFLFSATVFTLAKPAEVSGTRHPINDRVYQARVEQDRWLRHASVSTTEHVAIETYQERHGGRNPPPRFIAWFKFAQGSDIVDEFPQLDEDLTPFWHVAPAELRRRAELMATEPGTAKISIKGGKVSCSDTGDAELDQDLDELVDMIAKFSQNLPDLTLPINLSPSPRVLPSWENVQAQQSSSADHLLSQRSVADFNAAEQGLSIRQTELDHDGRFSTFSASHFRQMQSQACPPDSPARTNPDWKISRFCSACTSDHSRGQLLDRFAPSLEVCRQPDLRLLHGFYTTTPKVAPIGELLPLFSTSKTSGFRDMLIPLPRARRQEPDIIWDFDRRYDSLVWRGTMRDQDLGLDTIRGSHKYRLLHLVSKPESNDKVSMILPKPGASGEFRLEKVSATEANRAAPMSVGMEDYSSCRGPYCVKVKDMYGLKEDHAEVLEHRYVLLTDEDDGPPLQMMRALRSNSVPLVSTIFKTWYTDRLMPWLHFVPVDTRLQGLHSTFAYFTGTERRPKVNGRATHMRGQRGDAEWIAQAGQRWAERALGTRDMEVYLFRLLLEWGRLTDDERDNIGTWGEGGPGGFHDSGWTTAQTGSPLEAEKGR